MIVIIDSGSTKSDWCLVQKDGEYKIISTEGLNPYFLSSEDEVKNCLEKEIYPFLRPEKVDNVYFFGSGCSAPEKRQLIHNSLEDFFVNADIYIEGDLLGAGIGTSAEKQSIIAIIGTGSSTCLFDGKKIIEQLPSLGFILGDEGSGAKIGMRILSDYLHKDMPEYMRENFQKKYPCSQVDFLDRVYKREKSNRFLAAFAGFAMDYKDDTYIIGVLKECFRQFFEKQVLPYPKGNPVNMVGSIAYEAQGIIRELAVEYDVEISGIFKSPILGLMEHYKEIYFRELEIKRKIAEKLI
ncbi:MAG: ATPase [Bacteroidales bacterium]|jgi:N-acetylglucosamine kinase-like BadF-type ATPase|nr:ATPase [Bacteroidales bacterium]